jgi:hypothetical protein
VKSERPCRSVDYDRSAVEVECTVCTESADTAEVDGTVKRISEIVRAGLAAAEYATSEERTSVPT